MPSASFARGAPMTGVPRAGWRYITDADALTELIGEPLPRVAGKARRSLHDLDRQWLAASPLCLVATSAADGSCDASPKGDAPGFAHVIDERTVALPERPGNRRADGFRNLLANPHVGLIFLVPGRNDTLRINGTAAVVSDAPFFDDMTLRGHRPRLALVVGVQEVFYHCAKALLRAGVWDPLTWQPDAVPSRAHIAKAIERPEDEIEDLIEYYGPSYADRLYS
jgi:PPOX class probable FMN-dependent enzyme